MFSTLTQKILLGLYIIVIISIPVGTYLVSQYQTIKSAASNTPTPTPIPTSAPKKEGTSSAKPDIDLIKPTPSPSLQDLLNATPSPTPTPSGASSFGPTLSFKIAIEGRLQTNQAERVFIGIMEGDLAVNPKFLLNFLVDVPNTGEYSNVSLAGLDTGSKYTAILKGDGQIATSSAFFLSPKESKLNDGKVLTLTPGDLNEDNVINAADYSIAKTAFGLIKTSQNWNQNADFNKDGLINIFDTSLVLKNVGKIGASGIWATTPTASPTATPSASLKDSTGGIPDQLPVGSSLDGSKKGHWIWVPN